MEQQDEHKVYFSINEVSEQIGVPASTLRYWEKQFNGIRPRKDGHGNRYLRDGLHPAEEGQQLMGRYIAKEIRNNYY